MAKATVRYLLSVEGRKKSLLAGGNGKEIQEIVLTGSDVTPDIINLGDVDSMGNITLDVGFSCSKNQSIPEGYSISPIAALCVRDSRHNPGYYINKHYYTKHFDTPQTLAALLEWEKARVEDMDEEKFKAKNAAIIEKYEQEFHKMQEEEKKREAERAEIRRREQAERETKELAKKAFEEEKDRWIKEHGSEYLQKAHELGYDCQRMYVTERANMEFPDYVVDFDDKACWNSRNCPGLDAMKEVEQLIEKGYQTKVVWLTAPPKDDDNYEDDYCDDNDFEECEAVVIRDYLGRYNLVRILS